MIKKLIILFMMAMVWFLPAYILAKNFDEPIWILWLVFGFVPALFVAAYLES